MEDSGSDYVLNQNDHNLGRRATSDGPNPPFNVDLVDGSALKAIRACPSVRRA